MTLASDPTAPSVAVRRSIPSTLNTPSLDPMLMLDGRLGSLESQAVAAIADHAQATQTPTAKQLEQIAVFEQTAAVLQLVRAEDPGARRSGSAPAARQHRVRAPRAAFFEECCRIRPPPSSPASARTATAGS